MIGAIRSVFCHCYYSGRLLSVKLSSHSILVSLFDNKAFPVTSKFMLLLMRNIYVSYVPLFVISSLKIDIKSFLSHSLQQIYFVLEKDPFFWNASFSYIYIVDST